jgi:DNA-binding GntR family transcriptional regulator
MSNTRLNRQVLTDELYTLLKQQIMSHTMSAGDKINIDKLARELGVSNIPIREALFRLASEGLVTIVPFKGMFVTEMSLKDVDEIFEIRMQLEELAIRKAIAAIPEERLLALREDLTTSSGDGDSDEAAVARLNDGLHGTILDFTGNRNLRQLAQSLIERIHRYLNLHHYNIDLAAERREHEAVAQALLDRDERKAVEAMRRHLRSSYERLRDSLQNVK